MERVRVFFMVCYIWLLWLIYAPIFWGLELFKQFDNWMRGHGEED
jgi:hypothetical protein